MTVLSRPFRWDDVPAMHTLVSENWRHHGPKVSLHIGDLYWGLRPQPKRDPERDVQLWHDADGSLVGFGWIDHSADGNLLLRDPEDVSLHSEMLDWLEAYARAKGCSECSAACFESDGVQIEQLQQRGYRKSSESDPHLHIDLSDAIAEPVPPAGYSVRNVTGPEELEARAAVHRAAWSDNLPSQVTTEVYEKLVTMPCYRQDLDLVATDADDRFVSCTNVWYDEDLRVGEFEPVGCDPAHRRKGVTRALMLEGLQRLRDLGAERAIVYTSSTNAPAWALYESCGFRVIGHCQYFTKQVA